MTAGNEERELLLRLSFLREGRKFSDESTSVICGEERERERGRGGEEGKERGREGREREEGRGKDIT